MRYLTGMAVGALLLQVPACDSPTGLKDRVASVHIERGAGALIGEPTPLHAAALDSAGEALEVRIQWLSRAPGIVSVSSEGVATGVRWGRAWIVARAGDATDSVVLPVGGRHGITVLGTLGGDRSIGRGLAAGWVVGSSTTAAGEEHAFRWRDGVLTDLGTLGGASSAAYGVNGAGDVVGESSLPGGAPGRHAFLYRDGVMTDLGTLGGGLSRATAIDDAGRIAGSADSVVDCVSGCALISPRAAVVWVDGEPRALQGAPVPPLSGDKGGVALSVRGDFVVGEHNLSAMLWELDGTGTILVAGGETTTSGGRLTRSASATGFTSAGAIVGWTADNHTFDGWIREAGTIRTLEYDPHYDYTASRAYAANVHGHVVGEAQDWGQSEWYGMLWRAGTRYDLNVLAPADYRITAAVAIDDDGRILANGYHRGTGNWRALLLQPLP